MGKDMKPQMDIVIVSNGKNPYLRLLTKNTIMSCERSSTLIDFRYIVIEQSRRVGYKLPKVKTLYYDFEFNYNRCLNLGLKHSESRYVALCNNDLEFRPHWAENIIIGMGDRYMSASPARRNGLYGVEEGYKIATHLNGWCIVIKRKLLEKIGELDTGVTFWYSDNIYADQLRAAGEKHVLVRDSVVRHLGSKTLRSDRNGRHLMHRQLRNYRKAREKYI